MVACADMELPREAADVAVVAENFCYESLGGRYVLAVLSKFIGDRVTSCEKGTAARRAKGILCVAVVKEDTALGKAVDVGGVNIWIPIAAQGVPALRVGADPENVERVVIFIIHD